MGEYITEHLLKLKKKYEIIGDARGLGLMIGVKPIKDKDSKEPVREEASRFVKEGTKRGIIFRQSKFFFWLGKCGQDKISLSPYPG